MNEDGIFPSTSEQFRDIAVSLTSTEQQDLLSVQMHTGTMQRIGARVGADVVLNGRGDVVIDKSPVFGSDIDPIQGQSPLSVIGTELGTIVIASSSETTIYGADGSAVTHPTAPVMDMPEGRKE
jgi:hypothetical protein